MELPRSFVCFTIQYSWDVRYCQPHMSFYAPDPNSMCNFIAFSWLRSPCVSYVRSNIDVVTKQFHMHTQHFFLEAFQSIFNSKHLQDIYVFLLLFWIPSSSLLNDYNLCLLNTGEPTYRHYSCHSFSVPDVSVCDPSLALEFDWLTHNDLCGSDHFPVILKTSLRDDEPAAEHWKFDRADWMSFRTLCMSQLSDELTLTEDPVAQFTDTLIEIANQTIIPKSHISKNKLPKIPWFNDVCKQAVKERKKAQRKLFWNPSAENILAFKQLKAKARRMMKTQRKTSWQSFCSSLTSKTKLKTVP